MTACISKESVSPSGDRTTGWVLLYMMLLDNDGRNHHHHLPSLVGMVEAADTNLRQVILYFVSC